MTGTDSIPQTGGQNTAPNPFLADMVTIHAATPKQEYSMPEPEPGQDNATENASDPTPESGAPAGAQHDPDKILKQAAAHVELFDFLASRGLAVYAAESSDRYKATDTEKEDLTKALADYYATLESPPEMPPWVMLLVVVSMVYGPKFITARKTRRAKKAAEDTQQESTIKEPIPFTVHRKSEQPIPVVEPIIPAKENVSDKTEKSDTTAKNNDQSENTTETTATASVAETE